MPLVERAHQPRRWEGVAASRDAFASLVREIDRVVGAEAAQETVIEIEVEAYERPFTGPEEFLQNVEEREWIALDGIGVVVRAASDDGLTVTIWVEAHYGARLVLKGSDRRSRNAIEPDVVAAIEKLTTKLNRDSVGARYVIPWYLSAVLVFAGCIPGFITELNRAGSLNPGNANLYWILWFLGAMLGAPALAGVGAATRTGIKRALPAAELLPDAGATRWSEWKAQWMRRARWLVSGVLFVAAVAGAVTGVLAAAH